MTPLQQLIESTFTRLSAPGEGLYGVLEEVLTKAYQMGFSKVRMQPAYPLTPDECHISESDTDPRAYSP